MSGDEGHEHLVKSLEDRLLLLERQVFGDDLSSRIQQQRKIPDELVQINSQIHRAVSNRESILKLMQQTEKLLELLELDESCHLFGSEAKANAILAAEPLIRRTHGLIQEINLDKINEAMNSDAVQSLTSLQGQLAKLRATQLEQEEAFKESSAKIKAIKGTIHLLVNRAEYV